MEDFFKLWALRIVCFFVMNHEEKLWREEQDSLWTTIDRKGSANLEFGKWAILRMSVKFTGTERRMRLISRGQSTEESTAIDFCSYRRRHPTHKF